MKEESTLFHFHDCTEPPPEVTDNQDDTLNLISNSLIEFPEQIEQELATFAHGILVNARNEYISYEGPFTQSKFTSRNSEMAHKRLELMNEQISNIEKIQYFKDHYQKYDQSNNNPTKK